MEIQQVLGWLAAVAVAVWAYVRRNRQEVLLYAAEAVAFAEKYYWGASDEALEQEALRYFEAHWPAVPASVVRALVREICRRRKVGAKGLAPGK